MESITEKCVSPPPLTNFGKLCIARSGFPILKEAPDPLNLLPQHLTPRPQAAKVWPSLCRFSYRPIPVDFRLLKVLRSEKDALFYTPLHPAVMLPRRQPGLVSGPIRSSHATSPSDPHHLWESRLPDTLRFMYKRPPGPAQLRGRVWRRHSCSGILQESSSTAVLQIEIERSHLLWFRGNLLLSLFGSGVL